MSVTFRERLIKLRVDRKWSQRELGDRVNLGQSTIAQYEAGNREPNMETILKFSEVFNVTADYLLGLSEKPHLTEQEDKKQSFATLKEIRNLIAEGKVIDIPEDRIDRIVEYLDMQIMAKEKGI